MTSIEKNDSEVQVGLVSVLSYDKTGTDNVLATITSANGEVVEITGDVDAAMKLAIDNVIEYDEEKDKKLLRKIDFVVLPMIMLLNVAMFMDKSSLSTSAILGIQDDLNMEGDMYSWLSSGFYLGYLVFELPASLLLQRFPLVKTLGAFLTLWSLILILHGAVHNYASLMVLRVLLGMLESSINPGLVMITGQYYKVQEQFMRTTLWFCANGVAVILMNCIGYAMVEYEDTYSISPWRMNFYIIGSISMVIGVLVVLHIPDDPSKAWFFSDEEKARLVQRLRGNQAGFGSKKIKMYQIKEALTDVVTWYCFWYGVSSDIPSGSLGSFGSILLNDDFGFSTKKAMLMKMPGGAVEAIGCPLLVWGCAKVWNSRMFISVFSTVICIIAACLLAFGGDNKNVKLAGFYLQDVNPISMIQCLSCFSSNTGGSTKKAVTNAIFLIGYSVGFVVGPQTFIDSQAPGYAGGKVAIVVSYSASLLFLLLMWWEYHHRNVKNAKRLREHPEIAEKARSIENIEFADLTDKENPLFVYDI
uniref:MFS transporter n=1 Tax=Cyberlindnera americana TaxID=36016 RepID=A0A5P8N8D1_9ASCO|nr:MFS transporter [Cyberlindnera americana]